MLFDILFLLLPFLVIFAHYFASSFSCYSCSLFCFFLFLLFLLIILLSCLHDTFLIFLFYP